MGVGRTKVWVCTESALGAKARVLNKRLSETQEVICGQSLGKTSDTLTTLLLPECEGQTPKAAPGGGSAESPILNECVKKLNF